MRRDFDPSFVTQYQPAFTELVRLGSIAAQKKVNGRDTLREDDTAHRLLITLQALNCDGLTAKETEALEYCLISLNESLAVPTVVAFAPSFITQYQAAFTELVRLGSIASQNKVDGIETGKEDDIAHRLLIILQALDSDGLTVKEVDALEYCLIRLNESLTGPTVQPLVNVSLTSTPVGYSMRAWAGLFNLLGQDVNFVSTPYPGTDYTLVAEHGSFALSGQDAAFVSDPYTGTDYSITAEVGSFTLSGQDASFISDPYPTFFDHRRGNTPSATECSVCPPSYGGSFFYTNPSDNIPTIGMTVYTSSALTTPFNGGDQWWAIEWDGPSISTVDGLLIGTDGVVDDTHICSVDCP